MHKVSKRFLKAVYNGKKHEYTGKWKKREKYIIRKNTQIYCNEAEQKMFSFPVLFCNLKSILHTKLCGTRKPFISN